jgi:hypothetical protein
MNGMINTTASEPHTANTDTDFWIEHDSEIRYSPGDIYVSPTLVQTPQPSAWGVTSMDDEFIQFFASAK